MEVGNGGEIMSEEQTIPVVWLNFNVNAPARGYWDQGILEGLIHHKIWKTSGGPSFSNYEEVSEEFDGAVVIVPGTQNVEYISNINSELSKLNWVLLIVTGDEDSIFPVENISHPNMKLWLMTPKQGAVADRYLGSGFPPGMEETLKVQGPEKPLDWYFSGQVTHPRRTQCIEALKPFSNGELLATGGFTQGLEQKEYWKKLGQAKIAPCPGGPATPDSFRLFESLEAGCIPIADLSYGRGSHPEYWKLVFGEVFFPTIENWYSLPEVVPSLLSGWPDNANRISASWQKYKRDLAYALDDDIRELSGKMFSLSSEEQITVLVPTSPIPSNPDTFILEDTIKSIREQLPTSEIIIMIDGVRSQQEDRLPDYIEYTRRVVWLCERVWTNVLPLIMDEHLHQAMMTRLTMNEVRTPAILFVEHDTPLVGVIPWSNLLGAIETGKVNVIRLHHEASILEPHKPLMLDVEPQIIAGAPLLRTFQWSQRPHLSSSNFYRHMLSTYFGRRSRTMIEDLMYGTVYTHHKEEGVKGWDKFRLWMFSPEGDMKRSTHSDGRRGDPKYSMLFSYDEGTPQWAPFPGWRH